MKNSRVLLLAILACLVLNSGCQKIRYNYKLPKVEKALANSDFEKAYKKAAGCEDLTDVVAKKEITYYLQSGDDSHAFELAQEFNRTEHYLDCKKKMVAKYISVGDFNNAITMMSRWRLEKSSKLYVANSWRPEEENEEYNTEVNNYNEMINDMLNEAALKGDTGTIEKGLKLYKPIVVVKSKKEIDEGHYEAFFETKNIAYESAVKRFTIKK